MAKNLLGTSTINMRTLLSNGKRYEVPAYQRDYSWTAEQWEDLWMDIEEIERSSKQHYMGALVLQEEQADNFRVIDGQQRLATVSLLVVAALHGLQELMAAGVEPKENETRCKLLRDAFLGSQHPVTLKTSPKLTLNQSNRRFYEGTILDLRTPPSVAALLPVEKPLWQAMQYFREKLRERFVDKKDGAGLANFIYETVATQLLFIQVTVEDEAGAYTVFETLNARGLELTASDLLKNYLLSVIHPTGDSNLRLALQQWQTVADRIPAKQIPDFLRHYVNSRRDLVRKDRVYRAMREDVNKPQAVFDMLRELDTASLVSEALDDESHLLWDELPEARETIRHLILYRAEQFKPLIFAVWRKLPRTELGKILRYCDIITFRYSVIGQKNPNKVEVTYNKVANAIENGTLTTALAVKEALSPIYVSDEEFKESFARTVMPVGQARTRLIRYVLCALEKQDHNVDIDYEQTPATIEHILPESPTAEWLIEFPNDLHERYVSRLGNYLLLESKLNSREAANKPLAEKLPVYQSSQYPTTKLFSAVDWTPRSIDGRQAHMAKLATAIWRL